MKQVLLDTHTAIWFFNGSPNLSETAKQVILNQNKRINVSVVSVWELVIKISVGKLQFAGGAAGFVKLIDSNGFQLLNITPEHLLELERLPLHHRDPFDRILIAAAISEKMEFVTDDRNIPQYSLQCVW
jgi:PIN domain nuclease of toxin-antitoxin system